MLQASEIGTSVGEHQREYLYAMAITKDPVKSSEVTEYEQIKQNLDLYNTKGVFPERATDTIEVKWAGETFYCSGVEASSKEGTLTFRADEGHKIRRFWRELKDLIGTEDSHAAYPKSQVVFDLSVYMLSVDKETITDAVLLKNCFVAKVGELSANKEGSGLSTFDVTIVWDRALQSDEDIGKTI